MQKACWHLPSRAKRSLRSRISRVSMPIPAKVAPASSTTSLPGEDVREVDAARRRHLLEERILVVPGPQVGGLAAEPLGEPRVGRLLPRREGVGGEPIALVERLEEPLLVHLGSRDREREPVPVAEGGGCPVPEPRELAHVVGDRRADRLRCLPGLAALDLVVALAEDPLDLVVVDGPTGDDAAVLGERSTRPLPRARRSGAAARQAPGSGAGSHGAARAGAATCPSAPFSRASRISPKSSGSASASERASSASTRRRSCSSVAATLASHQASDARDGAAAAARRPS